MNLGISIILSLLLGLFAYIKKALTTPALLLAIIFSICITHFGGITTFIILVVVFLGSVITKLFTKKKSQEKRKTIQIIANVGTSTLVILLYKITSNPTYLLIYAAVMAESLADTLASDIGILSKSEPINILTGKKGEKGISGNISILGLLSSLLGSFVIGIIYYIGINNSIISFIIIVLSGFLGSIVDSILGASIQVKYKCPICKKITERKIHCKEKTKYERGIKWIDNNVVNLLSNLSVFLLLWLLLIR